MPIDMRPELTIYNAIHTTVLVTIYYFIVTLSLSLLFKAFKNVMLFAVTTDPTLKNHNILT